MAPPRKRTPPHRRSVLDFSGGQTGDVRARDSAGRDILHGLPYEFIEKAIVFRDELLNAYQSEIRATREQLRDIRNELDLYQAMVRQVREADAAARRADTAERERRQKELDAAMALQSRLARQRHVILRWCIGGLALAVALELLVIGWLVYDQALAGALLRLWLGASLALTIGRLR